MKKDKSAEEEEGEPAAVGMGGGGRFGRPSCWPSVELGKAEKTNTRQSRARRTGSIRVGPTFYALRASSICLSQLPLTHTQLRSVQRNGSPFLS